MPSRSSRHHAVAAALDKLADTAFADALPLGEGVGGSTSRMTVDGTRVFVKRVPLTDRERDHPHSTRNLFDLPTFYQYGVGSAGFGGWRELAAHQRTTRWVLEGECANFPLLHHWRVVETPCRPADVDEQVAYWDGSAAVRARLEAMAAATTSLLLVLEYVPQNLNEWWTDNPGRIRWADDELHATIDFLNTRGMVHFDAHPGNVLCDGRRLYVTDFGLALDAGFDLSAEEAAFLDRHRDFDRPNIERYLAPMSPDGRHAEVATKMNDFYDRLVRGPKSTVRWPL